MEKKSRLPTASPKTQALRGAPPLTRCPWCPHSPGSHRACPSQPLLLQVSVPPAASGSRPRAHPEARSLTRMHRTQTSCSAHSSDTCRPRYGPESETRKVHRAEPTLAGVCSAVPGWWSRRDTRHPPRNHVPPRKLAQARCPASSLAAVTQAGRRARLLRLPQSKRLLPLTTSLDKPAGPAGTTRPQAPGRKCRAEGSD